MQQIVREELVTNSRAKDILSKRKKEIELGYEQKNAMDYLKKYDKLTLKKSEELIKKLAEVERLRERQIIMLVNVLPQDNDDLRLVLEKDYNILTDEEKYKFAFLNVFDRLTPKYDNPNTVLEVVRWFKNVKLIKIQVNGINPVLIVANN